MQTFLPYADFTESAHCLDNRVADEGGTAMTVPDLAATEPVRLFVDPKGSVIQSLRVEIAGDAVYLSRAAVLALMQQYAPHFGTRECNCDSAIEDLIESVKEME